MRRLSDSPDSPPFTPDSISPSSNDDAAIGSVKSLETNFSVGSNNPGLRNFSLPIAARRARMPISLLLNAWKYVANKTSGNVRMLMDWPFTCLSNGFTVSTLAESNLQ